MKGRAGTHQGAMPTTSSLHAVALCSELRSRPKKAVADIDPNGRRRVGRLEPAAGVSISSCAGCLARSQNFPNVLSSSKRRGASSGNGLPPQVDVMSHHWGTPGLLNFIYSSWCCGATHTAHRWVYLGLSVSVRNPAPSERGEAPCWPSEAADQSAAISSAESFRVKRFLHFNLVHMPFFDEMPQNAFEIRSLVIIPFYLQRGSSDHFLTKAWRMF